MSENLDIIGYSSSLVFGNLGSLPIYQIATPLLLGVIHVVSKRIPDKYRDTKVGRLILGLNQDYWWNGQIGFWHQNYLVLSVSGLISIYKLHFNSTASPTQIISSVVAVILISWSVLFPLSMYILYQKHLNPFWMRSRRAMEGRFDILLKGVNLKSHNIALWTVFLPFVRLQICALTVTVLGRHQFSGLIFVYTTLIYLAFLISTKTQEGGRYNYFTIFEQVVILFLSYLLLLLTDYVQDEIHYESISDQFVYGTLILIAVTLIVALFVFGYTIYRNCKVQQFKR